MFVTEKPALQDALALVTDIVKSKNKFPILDNVLIERDGDMLTARTSNQAIEMCARFSGTIGDDFQPFTCPAKIFVDIVRNAPEDRITVSAVGDKDEIAAIQIKSGRSRLKLPALPAGDFPKLDAGKLTHQISCNADTLQKALKAVEYAAEIDQTRYYICGVRIEPTAEGVTFVATDGKRIAVRNLPAIHFDQDDLSVMAPITIPSETVDKIIKLLDGNENVVVDWSAEKIRVESGATSLTSKLVDGNFAAWRNVQPSKKCTTSRFSGKTLHDAMGRLLTITPDAGNGIAFTFEREAIKLQSKDISNGEGEDEVTAETDGEIKTGFHGRHLREAISHSDGDAFELLVSHGPEPALLRAAGDESNFTILMPMRVKGMLNHG